MVILVILIMSHSLLAQVGEDTGETSRILCMMLSTLKNRTVIGDHHPILLEKTHLFAATTYYTY